MDKYTIFMLTIIGLILSATAASWNKALSEAFTDYQAKDGYTCEWAECRKPGPGPRLFHIRCKKTQGKDVKSYECVYKANPHCCNAYNKKGNQEKYYRSLARKAAENRQTACDQDPLTSNAMCKEVDFKQVLFRSPEGNNWCVESERMKRDMSNKTQEQGVCSQGNATNIRDHSKFGMIYFVLIALITLSLW